MNKLRTALLFTTALFMSIAVHADNYAIDGYSPVAYFTEGEAMKGDPSHSALHEGKTYLFRNNEELEAFTDNPEKYTPRYDLCPYSLTTGSTLPIDPTNFKIVGGYLLLFHQSEQMDGLVSFEASGLTEQELLERADKQFKLLTF